ncbi:YopX family protein [Pedobacter sp. Du54]|uniref:YopX family protein n=1 Tax=Pedobacter anseongensis TaxID=3133439 RepID=UPI00309CDCA3
MQTEKTTTAPITLLVITSQSKKSAKQKTGFFIPEIIEINGVKVPSTPYKDKYGNPIFLGDVIKTEFDGDFETTVINMIEGTYVSCCRGNRTITPLYVLEQPEITILGNSIKNPELLKKLTK